MFFREKKLLSFHVQGVPRGTFKVRVVIVNQPQPESWRVHGVWTSRRKKTTTGQPMSDTGSFDGKHRRIYYMFIYVPSFLNSWGIDIDNLGWDPEGISPSSKKTPQDDRCMTAAQKNWKVKVWKHVKICQRNLNYTFVSSHSTTPDNYMDWSLVQRHGLQRPLC